MANTSFVSADINRPEVDVNFYTLASNQDSFNQVRVSIVGWIGFYTYGNEIKVLLFPSKESLSTHNKRDAISIVLNSDDLMEAKGYLDRQFVTVYGKYNQPETLGNAGFVDEISDIDIVELAEQ